MEINCIVPLEISTGDDKIQMNSRVGIRDGGDLNQAVFISILNALYCFSNKNKRKIKPNLRSFFMSFSIFIPTIGSLGHEFEEFIKKYQGWKLLLGKTPGKNSVPNFGKVFFWHFKALGRNFSTPTLGLLDFSTTEFSTGKKGIGTEFFPAEFFPD